MNLAAIIPLPYRLLALAALAAALLGFGWLKGAEHGQRRVDSMVSQAVREGARITAARDKVTTRVETKYLPAIARAEVITETIVKEVPVYVSPADPDLSGGFRVLHDAAALGLQLPGPAAIRDAAAVTAQDAARTVAENYGACRSDQLKLQELQEWATEQGRVK